MSRIWTVARRELRALFDQPTGYVLLVVFLAINGFLFFRQAFLQGSASLRPMLDLFPWVMLFFVPAVTMRALAEDTRGGQLEVLLAQPMTELELLLGKYLGALLFLWFALVLTLPLPLALEIGSDLQWGPVVAQYVGAALLMAGFAAVGVWASSLSRSQITAFIAAVAVMFVLILVGLDPLIVGLPATLGAIAARLGVLSHFESITRGVIDLRDAVYFLSLAGVFLALAYGALLRRKLSTASGSVGRLRLGVGLLVAILVVVNLFGGYIGGRLDLTPGNSYTLAPASRDIVRGLDDIVTIKLFASEELPTEAALLKRDVDDLLRDLRSAGRGKVRVVVRDPSKSEAAATDARDLGIGPVQFNVLGQSELQVKQGWLGLTVQYANGTEAIPFVQRTDNLEYRLATAIRTLTRAKKPVLGLVMENLPPGLETTELREQLQRTYEVRNITLSDSAQPAADVTALMLVGNPDSLSKAQLERYRAFLARGGGVLVLASGMQLSPRMPMALPKPPAWNPVLEPFGVSIRPDMVYDLLANEIVPVPTEFGQVLQQYPLFVRARSTGASPVNQEVQEVTLTWTSTIDTTKAKRGTVTPLLISSRAGGRLTDQASLDPSQNWSQTNLGTQLLAASVAVAGKTESKSGRVVVVGSADFIADRFARRAPDNLALALNSVDWLAQDEALIAIRSKDRRPPALVFPSEAAREAVKYANVIGVPALVALAGLIRLIRRRRKTRQPWRPAPGLSEQAI
jgi:ABC-type uncharacterized transport system involved in gliding motility auxiliary subunit/ABC-type transport system involved in multi-copper enzyme maturation permease subunit